MRGIADDIDVFQFRQPVADYLQLLPPALVGHDRPGAGIRQAKFQRVLAEQREQRNRDKTSAKRRQMHDRQFQRLRQEHRDAVAAPEAILPQHIGEPAGHFGHLVERGARRRTVLVDIDQRQPPRTVGMAVAAGGGDIEPRRDVPAEIAVEGVVVGGLGEHGTRLDHRRPGINPGLGRRAPKSGGPL